MISLLINQIYVVDNLKNCLNDSIFLFSLNIFILINKKTVYLDMIYSHPQWNGPQSEKTRG